MATSFARRDVICVIGFPTYPRALVDLARFTHERGFRVLALTDNEISPLAALGAPTLVALTTPLAFVDGYAGAICLITAALTEFARAALDSGQRSLAEYEKAARRTRVFAQTVNLFQYTPSPRSLHLA